MFEKKISSEMNLSVKHASASIKLMDEGNRLFHGTGEMTSSADEVVMGTMFATATSNYRS